MKHKGSQVMEHLREIELQSPADIILQQVKELIAKGVLKPGDRLPPERALTERFGVGRGHIREALKRLEFCGLLKTIPQSGTIVAHPGMKALDNLLSNVLALEKRDLRSLMETRAVLEVQAARLAASRASQTEITDLEHVHEAYCDQVRSGGSGLEQNVAFHLKIAECARNPMLYSLIKLLAPDIVTASKRHERPKDGRSKTALKEHAAVLDGIRSRDPDRAGSAMEAHMQLAQRQFEPHLR